MYTPIELDKTRNFRYGMKALSLIEKKLEIKISNFNLDNLSIEDLATVILCGLQHEDNDLTVDKLMDLIDEHSDLTKVTNAMAQAFSNAFPKAEKN